MDATARDPRHDPQPGDRLLTAGRIGQDPTPVEVLAVHGSDVIVQVGRWTRWHGSARAARAEVLTLAEWRREMRGAEVIP